MALSYPLTMPTKPGFTAIMWKPRTAVGMTESIYSFAKKVYAYGGKTMECRITLPIMTVANAKQWFGFFLALNGMEGTFYLRDTSGLSCSGAGGYPLVKGASQTGSTLLTDNWTASTEKVLRAGDWLSIGTNLHVCVQDVDSDASGNGTLEIWPDLRSSPADNAAIEIDEAVGLFRLSDVVPMEYGVENLCSGFQFDCVEAI